MKLTFIPARGNSCLPCGTGGRKRKENTSKITAKKHSDSTYFPKDCTVQQHRATLAPGFVAFLLRPGQQCTSVMQPCLSVK